MERRHRNRPLKNKIPLCLFSRYRATRSILKSLCFYHRLLLLSLFTSNAVFFFRLPATASRSTPDQLKEKSLSPLATQTQNMGGGGENAVWKILPKVTLSHSDPATLCSTWENIHEELVSYLTLQFIQQLLQPVDLRAPVLSVFHVHTWTQQRWNHHNHQNNIKTVSLFNCAYYFWLDLSEVLSTLHRASCLCMIIWLTAGDPN